MALQAIANINVDFYDKKYISINAKQLDKDTRFLSVTCYSHGELYPLNSGEHSAYIRYRKPDGFCVFNVCEINLKGKILVELTEQMLATSGICYVDLVVTNHGGAVIDETTGKIVAINDSGILSTMPFYIDVFETAFENSEIESSYEYDGLNDLIKRAEADYEEVVLSSKSWAVGDTNIRDGENTNNSKYWSEQSSSSASVANTSSLNAAESERIAEEHMHDALIYSQNAQTYMTNAQTYMTNAQAYMDSANQSESNAEKSEQSAKNSEINAQTYMDEAYVSEQNAKTSELNANESEANAESHMNSAKTSEANALNSANKAQSYAVGGTGTRSDEDIDNAYYYYGLIRNIVAGLDTGFIPMGTVSFDELLSVEKQIGYIYNIRDDFVTDNTFREGAGKPYTAGTNVYYTDNEQWDCFGGTTSPTASVGEVKDYLSI